MKNSTETFSKKNESLLSFIHTGKNTTNAHRELYNRDFFFPTAATLILFALCPCFVY